VIRAGDRVLVRGGVGVSNAEVVDIRAVDELPEIAGAGDIAQVRSILREGGAELLATIRYNDGFRELMFIAMWIPERGAPGSTSASSGSPSRPFRASRRRGGRSRRDLPRAFFPRDPNSVANPDRLSRLARMCGGVGRQATHALAQIAQPPPSCAKVFKRFWEPEPERLQAARDESECRLSPASQSGLVVRLLSFAAHP
jgi:hypothetical protein